MDLLFQHSKHARKQIHGWNGKAYYLYMPYTLKHTSGWNRLIISAFQIHTWVALIKPIISTCNTQQNTHLDRMGFLFQHSIPLQKKEKNLKI